MAGNPLEQLHVLIVDDNEHMTMLLAQILRSLNIREISSATDGASAFAKMREHSVDLVICDWNMKPIDGLKFTRMVRRNPESPDPFVPIIMLTAHAEPSRVKEARDCGVNEFLAKPVAPAVLLSRIEAVIDDPRSFIKTKDYFGPDRRRQRRPYAGPERRRRAPREEGEADDADEAAAVSEPW